MEVKPLNIQWNPLCGYIIGGASSSQSSYQLVVNKFKQKNLIKISALMQHKLKIKDKGQRRPYTTKSCGASCTFSFGKKDIFVFGKILDSILFE